MFARGIYAVCVRQCVDVNSGRTRIAPTLVLTFRLKSYIIKTEERVLITLPRPLDRRRLHDRCCLLNLKFYFGNEISRNSFDKGRLIFVSCYIYLKAYVSKQVLQKVINLATPLDVHPLSEASVFTAHGLVFIIHNLSNVVNDGVEGDVRLPAVYINFHHTPV